MNSRDAQDVILRLLADGPLRSAALRGQSGDPGVAFVLARVDAPALDRFGRFLCRHYYRERVVHFFKYSRALAAVTGRAPEVVLKTPGFNALLPQLVMGELASARKVLALLETHLLNNADTLRVAVPYWDDLVRYQGLFFLTDALSPDTPAVDGARFPARAPTAAILELAWDLSPVLPLLLKPFERLPEAARRPTRLLFARSAEGEVSVLRCTDALRDLLEGMTGEQDPAEVARRLGLDAASLEKTMQRLEQLGAVISQGSFSASHRGSEVSAAAAPPGR